MRVAALIITFFSTLNAAEIRWINSYKEALELSKKEKKNILVLITSTTCPWCRKLENTTLEDSAIIDRINTDYIALALTRGKSEYPQNKLSAKMVPMSYFLSPDEKIIYKIPGYWDVQDYQSVLDDVERKSNHYEKGKN
jgi:thioredoxin-related protein